MVIGVMVSGILAGLVATIGSFSIGFPLWVALILYPVMGTLGAVAFIAFALSREKAKQGQELPRFSPEFR